MNLLKIKEKFHNKGFVIIKKAFTKEVIFKVLTDLEKVKMKAQRTKNNQYFHKTKDNKFNTIHNIQIFHKKGHIIDISNNIKLKKIIGVLLGDKAKVRNIEFFLKPKLSGLGSPFHQDNYYWNIIEAKAANVWIACSNSSKLNGGLCYYESSNILGTIKHEISYAKGSSQKVPNYTLKNLKFRKRFPTLKTGDCLIHHPNVIHGSFKNKSKYDRVGLVVSYQGIKSKIDKNRLKLYKLNLKKNLKTIY